MLSFRIIVALLALLGIANTQALAMELSHGLIIKFKGSVAEQSNTGFLSKKDLINHLTTEVDHSLEYVRQMSGAMHIFNQKTQKNSFLSKQALLEKLQADPSIEYAEWDTQVFPQATATDYYFSKQWPLQDSSEYAGAINLLEAWDNTEGLEETVIAVIDTGILKNHVDIKGKLIGGYDFIKEFNPGSGIAYGATPESLNYFRSNDGDGRDDDPSDPGDWIDSEDLATLAEFNVQCPYQDSSFHGTGIAGIIAGETNHNDGITGINRNAKILALRVSGKCGGSRSDMVDAIRYAAGIDDPNLPHNPHPAKIINLSLGAPNACGFSEQAAITEAHNKGVIIISAAGNGALDFAQTPTSPASCKHVIAVGAITADGARAYYSNYGERVDISAPGGEDTASGGTPLLVATNHGITSPSDGSHFKYVSGTSAATAHVSGVVSLMLAANPALSPDGVLSILQQSAREFPTTEIFSCSTQTCGAGILDAKAAVQSAMNGFGTASLSEARQNDVSQIETGLSGSGAGSTNGLTLLMLLLWCLYVIRHKQQSTSL